MAVIDVLVENGGFQNASVMDAAAWRDRYELQYPVLADVNRDWARVWGNRGSPQYDQHSYTIVDPQGIVVWRREGATTANAVLADIFAQLEQL